ncbi:polyamine ABC transporter substrate-binding protein [Amorphus orientalis]|uniref:Putrescine-binding periplasmic protein n=1 Tax=Amorphus orientalis TaxID=649198 RepID=A0AAE3VP72_9HYPH|nr:polyamine ABC transporter substrate-binding protein [Amorphus orientalis]MDQ0315250.1 putrescine transport system substrate-binding protein [Amorphus orientalis]
MRGYLLSGLVAAAMMAGAPAMAQDKVVNVYNWSDYIDESILADFQKETGIKVNYDVFDSNELLETKLLAGSTGYDVVVPSATFLARQIQAGVFQKLDKSKLTNIDNMWPAIEQRVASYDPDNAYSVNYMWGTTGIGYNVDKVKERLGDDAPLNSWALVFDPANAEKLADCGIQMLDAPEEVIPAALNYLGIDPNTRDADSFKKVEEMFAKVRPYIQKFHSSEYINALANGDICVAIGWSGDVFQAADRAASADAGVEVAYSIPKEGAQMWFDQMAIPADAPHLENALTFINYMMKPQVIAKATNYVWYANGNKASQEYIDPEILNDPQVYPPEDVLERLFVVEPYNPRDQRMLTRTWTTIKSGI